MSRNILEGAKKCPHKEGKSLRKMDERETAFALQSTTYLVAPRLMVFVTGYNRVYKHKPPFVRYKDLKTQHTIRFIQPCEVGCASTTARSNGLQGLLHHSSIVTGLTRKTTVSKIPDAFLTFETLLY